METKTEKTHSTLKNSLFQKQKALFFTLALINNASYIIIVSAANSITALLKKTEYMTLISTNMSISGTIIAIIYTVHIYKYKIEKKVSLCFLFHLFGVIFVLFAISNLNFFFCLIGTIFIGIGNSLGISVYQAYLQEFDQSVHVSFTSGTGFSGVFGAFFYMILNKIGVSDFYVIFAFGVFVVFMFLGFKVLERLKLKEEILDLKFKKGKKDLKSKDLKKEEEGKVMQISDYVNIFNKIKYISLNYGLGILFTYSCITYLSSNINENVKKENSYKGDFYALIQLIFRFGDFLFSSSLMPSYKTNKRYLFTFVTLSIYMILFFFLYIKVTNIYLILFLMFILGNNFGNNYINTTNALYDIESLKGKEKEIALTFHLIILNTSIFLNGFKGTYVNLYLMNSNI